MVYAKLFTELEVARKQVILFNKHCPLKPLPKALEGRVKFLTGYVNALEEINKPSIDSTIKRVQNSVNELYRISPNTKT